MKKVIGCFAALALAAAMGAAPPRKSGAYSSPADNPCCYQGEIMKTGCLYPPAYNAPAKIDLNTGRCIWPYNIFADVSFIYWYAAQDGMTLAGSADLVTVGATRSELVFNLESVPLVQDFKFSPGFKIGIGTGIEESELRAEYTWYRLHSTVNSDAPTDHTGGGTLLPVWELDWFAQGVGAFGEFVSATHVDSSWHLGIDQLDVTGGRPYYQSKTITISPFGGLRAIWIRESLLVAANVPGAAISGGAFPLLAPQPIKSHNRSNSWGLGPVFGASGHYLLGSGFRLEGDGGFSILFTQYTKLLHSEDAAVLGTVPTVFKARETNYNTVRPMANLDLGVGWGKYLCNASYHIDFSADYSFSGLWDQNMIRTFFEEFVTGRQIFNDLFLQGLTITGRFDF